MNPCPEILCDTYVISFKVSWADLYVIELTKTCLLNTAISSLKDSDEHTSPPATPGSRGVHVASSHFSNIRANNGNNGCLQGKNIRKITIVCVDFRKLQGLVSISKCYRIWCKFQEI